MLTIILLRDRCVISVSDVAMVPIEHEAMGGHELKGGAPSEPGQVSRGGPAQTHNRY